MHVITGLNSGGAETALCRLLESSRAPECEIVVVALGPEGALSGRIRAAGANLIHMNIVARRPDPLFLLRLRRILRKEDPDIVQGWMYHGNLTASLSALGCRRPVVWGVRHSLHDLATEKLATRLAIGLGAFASRLADIVIYNSKESARQHEAIGYCTDRTRIIRNGFDTETFRPNEGARARIRAELGITADELVIGHVARWHPTKDHSTLLRAAALHLRTHPRTVFVLIGRGVDSANAQLVSLVRQFGVGANVKLCGYRADVALMNAVFDVATLSSCSESFPNAIGEAMACGVPCVATDVGGVREIIGGCGVVVARGSPEQLSAGWQLLIDMERAERVAIGQRARMRISEQYSLDACTAAYWTLYGKLLGLRPSCASSQKNDDGHV